MKNFPLPLLLGVPWQSAVRYFWHAVYLMLNRGAAAQFRNEGHGMAALAGMILKAHWTLFTQFGELRRKRRAIRRERC